MGRTDEAAEPHVLAPEQVVSRVLEGCRRSSREAARQLWRFGAEKLRRTAGDPEHLERLLGNEFFGALIGFERVDAEPLERLANSARQTVRVYSGGAAPARFLFSLKWSGDSEGTGDWLITGLEREC